NGFVEPPGGTRYEPELVKRYRDGQRARVERLDALARERGARRRDARTRWGRTSPAAERRRPVAADLPAGHATGRHPSGPGPTPTSSPRRWPRRASTASRSTRIITDCRPDATKRSSRLPTGSARRNDRLGGRVLGRREHEHLHESPRLGALAIHAQPPGSDRV